MTSRSKAYQRWLSMIRRCTNPKDVSYKHYGARGIKVCPRWRVFQGFYDDVGDAPPGHSIDRINNDGDYEPDNWRWATPKQQAQNKRRRRKRWVKPSIYDHKPPSVPTNVRLPQPLAERVNAYSKQHHIPVSVIIRLAVQDYLDKRNAA